MSMFSGKTEKHLEFSILVQVGLTVTRGSGGFGSAYRENIVGSGERAISDEAAFQII